MSVSAMTKPEVVIAVDPHKASWTAAAVGHHLQPLATIRVPVTGDGYRALRRFARQWPEAVWAIEGAAGLGAPLTARLRAEQITVIDVPAKLAARVRLLSSGHGRKNDDADALSVGVAALTSRTLNSAEIDASTGHGPPPLTGDPVEVVQQALHRQGEKRLAIDTGEPLAFWPIEDLVAEKHRLTGVLAAYPPDRSHDIAALTARREQVQAEIEPLVYRYNELADRKLRGPGTRSEMRDLREQIGERSKGLDRLNTELDDAQRGMSEREQFQTDHAHDAGFLDAVDHELDRQLRSRARQIAADPTDYHLHILGSVPTDPEHQVTWLRGATILDRHFLGLDRDPAQRDRTSLLGGPREMAETMARLEVMSIPRAVEPVQRTVDLNVGLGL